jgi:serine/threonine protein kinase
MGIVYEGFDPFIERAVAIKTIQKSLIDQSEAPEVFSRFRREAQAAGRLSHPNIVSIYEYGEEGDVAFIAMELLVGMELKEYFDKAKRFHIDEVANIMFQLLGALEYSHGRGVVHRDIKPSNILITKDGKIKIADFGIAKIESSDLTQVGTVLGTPAYMSPEQFMGLDVDRRSDIYSAGVLLYQLLTGDRPFTGSNMTIIMHKVIHQAPVPPSKLRNLDVSKFIDEVVKKALAKRPEDRFQTAAEFMEALKLAIASSFPSTSTPDSEVTIKLTPQNSQHGGNNRDAAIAFNLSDFEERLEESQREAKYVIHQSVLSKQPQENELTVTVAVPAATHATPPKEPSEKPAESGLLARLALEAKKNTDAKQTLDHEKQATARRVHDALDRILKFFTPFIKHVNNMEPTINRTYRLDARTVFANLRWQGATVDYRKQSLADAAHLAYVAFSVNLRASGPVLIKRPWDQFDAMKSELHHLRLRVLDDLEEIYKKPKQEWLQARLDPALPVQITFQGNYENGKIDVVTRNLENFGTAAFRLESEAITPVLMDEIGLFIIGRTNKLPELLRRI